MSTLSGGKIVCTSPHTQQVVPTLVYLPAGGKSTYMLTSANTPATLLKDFTHIHTYSMQRTHIHINVCAYIHMHKHAYDYMHEQ